MRITLVHNPRAGHGGHDRETLIELLRSAGYDPAYLSSRDDGWRDGLQDPGSLVVAAGGDGTVSKVARELLGREIPLGVVPVGTANNLAGAFGISGTPEALVPCLPGFHPAPFDVGLGAGPGEGGTFFEVAGVGILPEVIRAAKRLAKKEPEPDSRAAELERDLRLWRDAVREAECIDCGVVADGRDLSGRYLMAAAFNTATLGPRIPLAAGASPGDGELDLLLVGAGDRAALLALVDARLERREDGAPALPLHRVRAVRLGWRDAPFYLDDEVEADEPCTGDDADGPCVADLSLHPGALRVMVPRDPQRGE